MFVFEILDLFLCKAIEGSFRVCSIASAIVCQDPEVKSYRDEKDSGRGRQIEAVTDLSRDHVTSAVYAMVSSRLTR
jgi:hypothetical protein